MDAMPDLLSLSDGDLAELIRKLTKEEEKISYDRRVLQGTLDILRGERTVRTTSTSRAHVSAEQLADILSRKAPPDGWGHEAEGR
jgi:RsiG-like